MPGRNLHDFKVGQWVGFSDSKWNSMDHGPYGDRHFRVAEVTGFSSGTYVILRGWKQDIPSDDGGFYPENLYTAEETEEILYHCSYCGAEGHNRRTCPNLEVTEMKTEEYFVGGVIDSTYISTGDFFTVEGPYSEYSNIVYQRVPNSAYLEGKVVASLPGGSVLSVSGIGNQIKFPIKGSEWVFHSVEKGEAIPFKPLSLWDLIETVLPASRLTLLYGPPGTGKTTIANSFGTPNYVSNITLTEETPAAELRGHFIPKGGEFVWMDGPALTEFKRGGRLVLNEIDKASGDALTFCHALLDDPGIARITLPFKDEDGHPVTLKPHKDFHVVATMNGEPEDLPEALRDRFAVRIHVDKVHPNAIKALPKDLRKIANKGVSTDQERSVSIRGWNAFVALREAIGEENAAQAVFGPRAKTILNTIKIDAMAAKSKEKK